MSDILMMIGAGIMQYPAIEVARKAGYSVVAVDGNLRAVGKEIADFFLNADISRWEDVLRLAEKFHKDVSPIGGVITVGTDFSYTVAKVAERFGLVGVSPETALAATRKDIMRKRLKEKYVPCPDFDVAASLQEARGVFRSLGNECVIKPVDNMGARGVCLVRNEKELDAAFPKAIAFSRIGRVIIEKYMEGPELSVDTLICDGQVYLLTVADRIISGKPYFIEKGHTIPSSLSEEAIGNVFDVMKKGIHALGITVGASKADMKVTPQGPMIGEMTARLSGGFHSQYTDPLATGMNSIKAAVDIAMGKPLDKVDITPKFHRGACERSIYPDPGKVVKISGIEDALNMKGIERIFLNVRVGENLYPVTSNMGKAGHVIAWGYTREEAIDNCEKALRKIRIDTVAA
ncbi:MAG: ATP-grasp domain-containing protein [Candidatus Aureabacteria bacterium]|nr:ATP-grasp domain-containing protein [Candidatus Auribacterota bacterium]